MKTSQPTDTAPPLVSFLMSVRNGEKDLPQTLDSVERQTFRDFEFVIVDDGSTDETTAMLNARAARDPRVRILRNDTSLGIPAALNRGLSECRGALIAKTDHDDVQMPERLERQVAFLRDNPDVGVVGSNFRRIDEDGKVVGRAGVPTDPDELYWRTHLINCFLHSAVTYRADLVRRLGGYDERYWTAQDSDLMARFFSESPAWPTFRTISSTTGCAAVRCFIQGGSRATG